MGAWPPAIWADWNQDGDFFDVAEAIVAPGGSWYPTFGGTKTATFTVPSTAVLGQTRLRVYVKAFPGPSTGPCATLSVGDIEDFNVYIQPSATLAADEFVLSVDESNKEPQLRWTWSFPERAAQFEVLYLRDGNWEKLAEVDGRSLQWQNAAGLDAGQYQIAARTANGQRSYSNIVERRAEDMLPQVQLSPNPVAAGGSFRLQFPADAGSVSMRILDASGRIVRADALAQAGLCYVSTEGWAAGIYFVQLRMQGWVTNLRLVVE